MSKEYPDFKDEPICRGSTLLGTACGKCVKCKYEELRQIYDEREKVPESTEQKPPYAPVGWVCPVCGRGNAPSTSTCACTPLPPIQWTC